MEPTHNELDPIHSFFRQITGFENARGEYQLAPAYWLHKGQNIVLRMPTGAGKSEALLCAYLWSLMQNETFPQQMIYGLPMRNLVDSLGKRFGNYQKNFIGISVATQHGVSQGTPKFYADIAVATIDQIISAYACTPLGYPVRNGNIPAGAIASAFLAFDEIHTFDPERALQSVLFIIEQGHKLNMPFAFLSATLPNSFTQILEQRFNVKVIDILEEQLTFRQDRQVTLTPCFSERLSADVIQAAFQECNGSLLVVCNTVQTAQDLWLELKSRKNGEGKILLLHSRFTVDDRQAKEKLLEQYIGKQPSERGIIITTQVVEVGLDVSTMLLLTELSPIDALIQRAGRVARWGGHGEVRVFGVERAAPYSTELVEATKAVLGNESFILTWNKEKELVNEVLDEPFHLYLTAANRGRIIYQMSEAAFSGKRGDVAKIIRQNQSCTVSIHDRANELGKRVWQLPQIRLNAWILLAYVRDQGVHGIGNVVTDAEEHKTIDQEPLTGCVPIRIPEQIRPNELYVLSPDIANYEPNGRGLVLGEKGIPFALLPQQQTRQNDWERPRRESWLEHCEMVLNIFYEYFLEQYKGVLERLAQQWKLEPSVFINRIAFSIALHDFGKLSEGWQQGIGRKPDELPIARGEPVGSRPAHATVSAYLLSDLLQTMWGRRGSEPFLCAIAHHHSVRAENVPAFTLIPEWQEQVTALLAPYTDIKILWNAESVQSRTKLSASTKLRIKLPQIERGTLWRTYTITSRILRLADQMAAGGSEYALLRDEKWLTDV